jgi:hypothetical protein
MKRVIIVAAIVVGVCVAYVLAHLALIEVGREVVVVHEPTPTGGVKKARLWIVDEGRYSWIHPGSANAVWWVQNMDAHPIVEIERGGKPCGTAPHPILRRMRKSTTYCGRNTA